MLKKTHMAVGVSLTTVAATALKIPITPVFLFAAAIGTIIPDMDHPKGAINNELLLVHTKVFKIITYVSIAIVLLLFGPRYFDKYIFFYLAPPLIVIGFARHRSVTHSLFALVGAGIILNLVRMRYGVNIIFPIVIGMATHMLLDMFNPQGIELLWPNKKNYRFPIKITTGTSGEQVLFMVFGILIVIFLILQIPEQLNYLKDSL